MYGNRNLALFKMVDQKFKNVGKLLDFRGSFQPKQQSCKSRMLGLDAQESCLVDLRVALSYPRNIITCCLSSYL